MNGTNDSSRERGELQVRQGSLPAIGRLEPRGADTELFAYLLVLWRWKGLIVVGTMLGGILAVALNSLLPSVYEAQATLIIQQPRFSTELRPAPLGVEIYREILKSDFIMDRVKSRLTEQKALKEQPTLEELKSMCRVQVYESEANPRSAAAGVLPFMSLFVQNPDPKLSAHICNQWIEVFLEHVAWLSGDTKADTLNFIESEYPVARDSLIKLETELTDKSMDFDKSLLRLTREWTDRIAGFKTETETLVADYVTETKRLESEFVARWKPELVKKQLDQIEEKMVSLEGEASDLELAMETQKERVEQIQDQLKEQPSVLVLSKAITDNALWDKIDGSNGLPPELDHLKLRTEEVNPTHLELARTLAEARIEYETLLPRKRHLEAEIARLKASFDELDAFSKQKDIEQFDLVTRREAGLRNLERKREAALQILEATYENETKLFNQTRDLQLARLVRDKAVSEASLKELAEKYQTAGIARNEQESNVRLGGAAVPPQRPINRNRFLYFMVGSILGLLAAIATAFYREAIRPRKTSQVSDAEKSRNAA